LIDKVCKKEGMMKKVPKKSFWDQIWQQSQMKPKPVWLDRLNEMFCRNDVLGLFKKLLAYNGVKFDGKNLRVPDFEENGTNLETQYCLLCLLSHREGKDAARFTKTFKEEAVSGLENVLAKNKIKKTKSLQKVIDLFFKNDINGLLKFLLLHKSVKLDFHEGFILDQESEKDSIEIYIALRLLAEIPGSKSIVSDLKFRAFTEANGFKKQGFIVTYGFGMLKREILWLREK